ncbi:MAG: hypothetical protein HN909_02995 [Phycisphaerales bacterium]|nr:hypothetical protein [Phycisphaerales bacterium]MBT7170719.1 hypothetical protein [Phycisphaerales bacterium]
MLDLYSLSKVENSTQLGEEYKGNRPFFRFFFAEAGLASIFDGPHRARHLFALKGQQDVAGGLRPRLNPFAPSALKPIPSHNNQTMRFVNALFLAELVGRKLTRKIALFLDAP